jgi:hypothetical protein
VADRQFDLAIPALGHPDDPRPLTLTRKPVLLLTAIGRRSGQPRTLPLMYLRDNGNLIVCKRQAAVGAPEPMAAQRPSQPRSDHPHQGCSGAAHSARCTPLDIAWDRQARDPFPPQRHRCSRHARRSVDRLRAWPDNVPVTRTSREVALSSPAGLRARRTWRWGARRCAVNVRCQRSFRAGRPRFRPEA